MNNVASNNVILFRPANTRRPMAACDRGAQILFFTGVRYQRVNEDPPGGQPRRERRKRQGGEMGGAGRGGAGQR